MNTATGEYLAVKISAVIFHDDGKWVAHGLEYDICAQGNSIEDATKAFQQAVFSNACVAFQLNGKPLEGIAAAPQKYWDMFKQARVSVGVDQQGPMRMPNPLPAIRQQFRLLEGQAA